jgi:hypothetical protein
VTLFRRRIFESFLRSLRQILDRGQTNCLRRITRTAIELELGSLVGRAD